MSHKNLNDLISLKLKYQRIFFYRICGTGMGAAASLLKEKGFDVQGGDHQFFPPMSDYLNKTEIPCHNLSEIDDKSLREFDLIVVGNVVPKNSDDAKRIESLGVAYCSFPAVLGAFILQDENVVGISGTHGKTTTSYYMVQILESLGKNPGHVIGGVIEGRASSRLGDGSYFVIESDEYDSSYFEKFSKFHSYFIDHLILTSLEFDHADIFQSVEDIQLEFKDLLKKIPGKIIANSDYPAIREIVAEACWYGEKSSNGPKVIKESRVGTEFEIDFEKQKYRFQTNIFGRHNILNLSSVLHFLLGEGFAHNELNKSLKNLKNVKRRQEVRGHWNKALLIDDFAHHPKAVKLTLESFKIQYPFIKLSVVFEPASATARSDLFRREFAEGLSVADSIAVIKPKKETTVKNSKTLQVDKLSSELRTLGKYCHIIETFQDLTHYLNENSKQECIIAVLSNGTCMGLWESELVENLS